MLARHAARHRDLFNRMELNLGGNPADYRLTSKRLFSKSYVGDLLPALMEKEFDACRYLTISSSGVPTMPRVFSSSRQGGTPHCMKKDSDAVSIQREKFGKKTMPAGSQSPKATSTRWVVVRGMVRSAKQRVGSARRHAQRAVEADHLAV